MGDTSDSPIDLLNQAVAAKAAVAVVAADGSGQSITAQFVAPAKPQDPGATWARPSVRQADVAQRWAAINARVSVRFMAGPNGAVKINAGAETTIVKYIRDYWLTETLPIAAMLLALPTRIWIEQRDHLRHQLRNDGGGIRATLSRPRRDGLVKTPGPESRATLWDLGLGGAGFICPFSRSLIETASKERFDITLDFKGKQAILPGRCTFARPQGNLLRIGVKFDPSLASAPATLLLEQVVKELEIRTARWEKRSA